MGGSFWKGLALGVLGFFAWIIFQVFGGFEKGITGSSDLGPYVGLSFTLMIFGPALFWVILPLKERWYDKGKRTYFYLILIPFILLLLLFLIVSFTMKL